MKTLFWWYRIYRLKQAWTQGEALESKYWFPCLEDPQVKFAREIQITVPENDYVVISNGELAQKEGNTWTWIERNPNPAYLTSVVIGKFAQEEKSCGMTLENIWKRVIRYMR